MPEQEYGTVQNYKEIMKKLTGDENCSDRLRDTFVFYKKGDSIKMMPYIRDLGCPWAFQRSVTFPEQVGELPPWQFKNLVQLQVGRMQTALAQHLS